MFTLISGKINACIRLQQGRVGTQATLAMAGPLLNHFFIYIRKYKIYHISEAL